MPSSPIKEVQVVVDRIQLTFIVKEEQISLVLPDGLSTWTLILKLRIID